MKLKLLGIASIFLAISVLSLTFSNNQKNIEPDLLTGEYDSLEEEGVFQGNKVTSSKVTTNNQTAKVLGKANGNKRIEVDLTNQKLYAYEGDQKIYDFLISSGKWGKTPTGTFNIWGKFRYIKMSGGSKALHTYYYLPNVPYVMFFSNESTPAYKGFGIHGTYWHNNFGHPMSHGCINMKTEEAGLIYNWADENPGTEIVIYGVAPKS